MKTILRWIECSRNVGLNYSNKSKYKPNKGVVTRNSIYSHKCVTAINNKQIAKTVG